ncbi:MAG TPA: DMT family transporter [Desulfobacterales bacterium]|nr:DMT family transporter [Desulfobacterales bacterium]
MASKENIAKLASIYAGLVFGIYWIPLRALGDAGFSGAWSPLMLNAFPLTFVCPVLIYRWKTFVPGRLRFHIGGLLAGLAFVLYANSFMYTEVIRSILLFYLMPIWGFLLARFVAGEVITPVRWLSMALGLGGLLIIFGVDVGLPLPRNIGDWMALGSGLVWAVASLMMLTDNEDAINYGLAFFLWGTLGAALMAYIASIHGLAPTPNWSMVAPILPWLIPLAILVVIPAGFAAVYGPTQLNPGVAGLLFMTEISVAAVTAALFADEPFGIRELLGIILISLAGLAEPLFNLIHSRNRKIKNDLHRIH